MNRAASESFTLVLSSAASIVDLQRWLAEAAPGHSVVYASGLDLPREADGVLLVRRWVAAGLVDHLPQQRDPADKRRWLWRAVKLGNPVGGEGPTAALLEDHSPHGSDTSCCTRHPATQRQRDAVLALLRAAPDGKCPSLRGIARALGLGIDQRSRRRAHYLLEMLVADGAISLAGDFPNRVVTFMQGRG